MKKTVLMALIAAVMLMSPSCGEKEKVVIIERPPEGNNGGEQEKPPENKPPVKERTPTPEYCELRFNYKYEGVEYTAICFKAQENAVKYSFYVTSGPGMDSPIYAVWALDGKEGEGVAADDPVIKKVKLADNCDRAYLLKKGDEYDWRSVKAIGITAEEAGKTKSDYKWSRDLTAEDKEKMSYNWRKEGL